MDKRIAILIAVIAVLLVGLGYTMFSQNSEIDVNNTTVVNTTPVNTTVENEATAEVVEDTDAGQYGYCAICGKALSYSEANNEYTQGKVCSDCASNPYYQTGEGADYANQKLKEAYPEDYEGMFEESGDNESADE